MHKPFRAHKTYTYANTALCAKDVFVRTHRLMRKRCTSYAKPYTYAQAGWRANVLHSTQSRLHCKKSVQPTHPDYYSGLEQINKKNRQWELQLHTSQPWLEKIKKGKCTNKYQRLNGKGTSIVTRGRWNSRAVSAHRSDQWGLNSHQAKNPHFGSSKKPDRGSTRKALDCPGLNWEKHHNGTQPVPF